MNKSGKSPARRGEPHTLYLDKDTYRRFKVLAKSQGISVSKYLDGLMAEALLEKRQAPPQDRHDQRA